MMKIGVVLLFAVLLVGCDKFTKFVERPPTAPADSQRYQLQATSDGKMFRLDTHSGQTWQVTGKGLETLPDDRRIQLRVGEIYSLENGKSAIYEGNETFNSDIRQIADALFKKHSNLARKSEVDSENAQKKADSSNTRK